MTSISTNYTLPTSSSGKTELPVHLETLVSRLDLAPSSESNSCLSTANNSNVSLPSLMHRHNLKNLSSTHDKRVKEIELAEQSLWKTISPAQANRADVDPAQIFEGKLVLRHDDRSILHHSGRRILFARDGSAEEEGEWRVVLEGNHHDSDEQDLDDPSIHEPYALTTSSRWDALFDAPKGAKNVKILEASYGRRDGDVLSNGEIGLGLKWVEEGEDVRDARWAWIWGELEEQDDDDEDNDEEDGDAKGEKPALFKSVHLVWVEEKKKEEETD